MSGTCSEYQFPGFGGGGGGGGVWMDSLPEGPIVSCHVVSVSQIQKGLL